MNVRVLVLGSTSTHECRSTGTREYQYAHMQEYWYSGGSTGTLYLFLTYVEVDLLSWGGRHHPDSRANSPISLLENNHCNKAFLDRTGVIIRTNAIGVLLQHLPHPYQTYAKCLSELICCPYAYGSSLTQLSSSLGKKSVTSSNMSCCWQRQFWDTNQLMYQCIVYQFLCTMIYLYEYILNSYFQSLAASFFDIRGQGVSKVSRANSYVDLEICMTIF